MTLAGVSLGGLWAAERIARAPIAVPGVANPAAQAQPIFRRADVRPSIKNPSANAREFFFTRAIYNGGRRWGSWATDFPKADRQFLTILDR